MAHDYSWHDVLQRNLDDVQAGDTFFTLEVGTAYHYAADGSVAGVGWAPLPDHIWYVQDRDGDVIRVTDPNGESVEGAVTQRAILRVRRADER